MRWAMGRLGETAHYLTARRTRKGAQRNAACRATPLKERTTRAIREDRHLSAALTITVPLHRTRLQANLGVAMFYAPLPMLMARTDLRRPSGPDATLPVGPSDGPEGERSESCSDMIDITE